MSLLLVAATTCSLIHVDARSLSTNENVPHLQSFHRFADFKNFFRPQTSISLGTFAQLTPTRIEGNATDLFSTNGISPTIGVLGTFRQQFRPWFGYSLNLGYTQAAERYTGTTPPVAPFGISDAGVLDLRKAMPTTAAARKQVGRFIPSADPRHRPRPFELLGLQCRDVQSVLDAISSGLRWSSVLASRVIRVLPKHSWRSISACVHGPLLLGKRGVSYASTRPSACFGLRRSTAAFHAREWLLSAVRGLNNKRPIDYTRTDFGAREVAV